MESASFTVKSRYPMEEQLKIYPIDTSVFVFTLSCSVIVVFELRDDDVQGGVAFVN